MSRGTHLPPKPVALSNSSRLKPHQIHDLAAAKEKEMEKVKRAFGIRDDYVEGDAFKRMKERGPE